MPEYTMDITGLGTLRLLEIIKDFQARTGKQIKFYQASSSEMFGKVIEIPQSEKTPFHPRSSYGCAKVFAYNITINYREAYGIFACNGILFNHESERRGEAFVTRKITTSLARIKTGLQNKLILGNLDAERDWGYAKDYVEAMWLILQQSTPDDYVIGTGEKHSVREFLEETAKVIGLNIHSNGKKGVEEKYFDENGNVVVEISPEYFRPSEVDILQANPSKAMDVLFWKPKVTFHELVRLMAKHDLEIAKDQAHLNSTKKIDWEIREKVHELVKLISNHDVNLMKELSKLDILEADKK